MEKYDYLFKENKLNFNNKFDLYYAIKDDNFLDNVSQFSLNKNSILELILTNENLLESVFKKDPLYIYKIIDFFNNNENYISKKQNNMKMFINENNLELLEIIYKNHVVDNYNIEKENISKNIILNKDLYFTFIFNQIWINNLEQFYISSKDFEIISKQMLIVYYYNMFYNKEKIDQIQFDNELYQDFLKLLIKYKSVYILLNNDSLILKTIEKKFYNNENKLKLFFYFCISNHLVNKNLLTWFFVLFYDNIPKYLHNDYYYIILNINKNILGVISKILKYANIDFYKYDEMKFNELIINISENNDYLYRLNEDLKFNNDINYASITNNILLIQKLQQLYDQPYLFLSDINLKQLDINKYHMFLLLSPLENSWKTSIYDIDTKCQNIVNKFEPELNEDSLLNLIKIYNSSICVNFKGTCNFLTPFGIKTIFNIEKNMILADFDFNLFDKEILFINIINYFNIYEIIPIFTKNIQYIIDSYVFSLKKYIDIYINIFPKEKQHILEYGY